ncbi:hypothetical protein [Sphingomonas desiccabilis]|uniref:Uncharacterized protein n=1 Tax=Sphingomonas desiccabilis TaxID=429134 RepID=A0A4Q2IY72_9SPHN|nr:hypothetical protein [Sphingomonas desiccabilis]MBB3910830.1 hypothetical protein [Sphingomonas desiccabilis]RXZ35436.1 hypothetical protein EO081_07415 [Sphingomonas desiccabilis]
MKMIAAALLLLSAPALSGPLSKFDEKEPVADYDTPASIGDVERCLIDMDGWLAPNVYRQPDRPDRVTLVWIAGGVGAGKAAARIDLSVTPAGTHVRSWMPAKQALACAPMRPAS